MLLLFLRQVLVLLGVVGCCGSTAMADQQSAGRADGRADGPPSLDERLLDDLDSDLFDHVQPDAAAGRSGSKQSVSPLDRQLLDQLGEGEDLGLADPLSQIANKMQAVEERIAARDTSDTTQKMQQQIVAELARLIEVQAKKCQCSGSSQNSLAQGNPSANPKPGDSPSRDSTNRLGQSPTQRGSLEDVQQMLKRVWGQLPDRLREQVQSASVEEFLPKYEQLIEQYYQRLAEQDMDGR
jgi:hypothetical protein